MATGGTPITLPGDGQQLTLRTLDDALALRARLVPGARVAIVGASWIGAEVATAALQRGCQVTCLELEELPLARTLGVEVARAMAPWWHDVDLRCTTAVDHVSAEGVVLGDGSLVPADVVVTGIGIRPEVRWLEDSGLRLDRGVLTDEWCRASVPDVVAVGDAAQRWSPRAGRHLLVEHWDDAGSAGTTAASALLTEDGPPFDPVPYFWSDQFGHKVQYVGSHGPDDEVSVHVSPEGVLEVATWTAADGTLSAWLGVDRPREVLKARSSVGGPSAEYAPT